MADHDRKDHLSWTINSVASGSGTITPCQAPPKFARRRRKVSRKRSKRRKATGKRTSSTKRSGVKKKRRSAKSARSVASKLPLSAAAATRLRLKKLLGMQRRKALGPHSLPLISKPQGRSLERDRATAGVGTLSTFGYGLASHGAAPPVAELEENREMIESNSRSALGSRLSPDVAEQQQSQVSDNSNELVNNVNSDRSDEDMSVKSDDDDDRKPSESCIREDPLPEEEPEDLTMARNESIATTTTVVKQEQSDLAVAPLDTITQQDDQCPVDSESTRTRTSLQLTHRLPPPTNKPHIPLSVLQLNKKRMEIKIDFHLNSNTTNGEGPEKSAVTEIEQDEKSPKDVLSGETQNTAIPNTDVEVQSAGKEEEEAKSNKEAEPLSNEVQISEEKSCDEEGEILESKSTDVSDKKHKHRKLCKHGRPLKNRRHKSNGSAVQERHPRDVDEQESDSEDELPIEFTEKVVDNSKPLLDDEEVRRIGKDFKKSSAAKSRSYRDGKPKDEELLFSKQVEGLKDKEEKAKGKDKSTEKSSQRDSKRDHDRGNDRRSGYVDNEHDHHSHRRSFDRRNRSRSRSRSPKRSRHDRDESKSSKHHKHSKHHHHHHHRSIRRRSRSRENENVKSDRSKNARNSSPSDSKRSKRDISKEGRNDKPDVNNKARRTENLSHECSEGSLPKLGSRSSAQFSNFTESSKEKIGADRNKEASVCAGPKTPPELNTKASNGLFMSSPDQPTPTLDESIDDSFFEANNHANNDASSSIKSLNSDSSDVYDPAAPIDSPASIDDLPPPPLPSKDKQSNFARKSTNNNENSTAVMANLLRNLTPSSTMPALAPKGSLLAQIQETKQNQQTQNQQRAMEQLAALLTANDQLPVIQRALELAQKGQLVVPGLESANSKRGAQPITRTDAQNHRNATNSQHRKAESASAGDEVPNSAVELNNSKRYLEKLQRQERAVDEVKLALKPFYSRKAITKDEYKEIMRKAVFKICHSRTGVIRPDKVRSLIDIYIKKFKHNRKKNKRKAEAASKLFAMPPVPSPKAGPSSNL